MQYQKEDVRRRIIEAGIKEYSEKGYRAGKISTIAEESGVPIGNIYRYFDGKSGLLDSIVGEVYVEFPRYVEIIAKQGSEQIVSLEELAVLITKMVQRMFRKNGREILILTDKCENTRYADFKSKIVESVNSIMMRYIFPNPKEGDEVFCKILTKAFVDMILNIFRLNCSDEEMSEYIRRLIIYCFYDVGKRVK